MKTKPIKSVLAFLIGIMALSTGTLQAQSKDSPTMLAIRKQYMAMQASIERCENEVDEPCALYLNTITHNKLFEPWPAVGIYTSQQDFWYHRDENGEAPRYQLQNLRITTKRSARTELEEYLFDEKGKLIFYFFKLEGNGDPEARQEFRFYFNNGALSDYRERVGKDELEYANYTKDDGKKVRENAERMLEIFEKMLNAE